MRQTGIELGRVAAVIAVIAIHADLAAGDAASGWYGAINQLSRFAVPFFFVTIGYFAKFDGGLARTGRSVLILLALYFGWYGLYALVFHADALPRVDAGIEGSHLWFLRSAAYCLAVVALLRRSIGMAATLVVCALLYVWGVGLGSYGHFLGLAGTDGWNPRNSLCFGAPFIAIGAMLAQARRPLRRPAAAGLLIAAAGLQLAEVWWLGSQGGLEPIDHDFVFSTLLYGVAAFLFFQSLNGTALAHRAARLGGLTLGIYLTHRLVIAALAIAGKPDALTFWPYVAEVMVLSVLLTAALSRVPLLRGAITTGAPWPRLPGPGPIASPAISTRPSRPALRPNRTRPAQPIG